MKALLITAALVGAAAAVLFAYYSGDITGPDKDVDELMDETADAFENMERDYFKVSSNPREALT